MSRTVEQELQFRRDRQKGIGATDVGAILGYSDWRNALDVYHEKTREVRRADVEADLEEGQSIHLLRGQVTEPLIARLYWQRTGRSGRQRPKRSHPEHPHLRPDPDAEIFADDAREPPKDQTGYAEWKAPSRGVFDSLIDEGIRKTYLLQIQFGMACTGLAWGSFGFGNLESRHGPIHPIDVLADEDLGRYLVDRMDEFWRHHVEGRNPPDPEAWAHDETMPDVRETTGEVLEVGDDVDVRNLTEKMIEAREKRNTWKDRYKQRRDNLQELLEERDYGTDRIRVPGVAKLTIVRVSGRTKFDRDALEDHRPVDRDALLRLADGVSPGRDGISEIVGALHGGDLDLDLDRFERQQSGYSYLKLTPEK